MKTYFMYGHGNWTGVLVSIVTFMLVLFDFVALHMAAIIPTWLLEPYIFFPLVFFAYMLPVTLLGWISYHKGEVAVRMGMDWKYNPYYQKLIEKLDGNRELLEKLIILERQENASNKGN